MNIRTIVLTLLLAVWIPSIALLISTTPLFLQLEYTYRLDIDDYGWSRTQRLDLAKKSLGVLTDLTNDSTFADIQDPIRVAPVYTPSERSHLQDVKTIFDILHRFAIASTMGIGVYAYYLHIRKQLASFTKALQTAAWSVIVTIAALAIYISLAWQHFFLTFHQVLFAPGSWTFHPNASLIRLFPEQFWIDYAVWYICTVLLVAIGSIITTRLLRTVQTNDTKTTAGK